uniref:Uncharacterized protein n=1 Tax=Globodera pallida TaxID=36090 RepID=A0A183BNR6_GLOPA
MEGCFTRAAMFSGKGICSEIERFYGKCPTIDGGGKDPTRTNKGIFGNSLDESGGGGSIRCGGKGQQMKTAQRERVISTHLPSSNTEQLRLLGGYPTAHCASSDTAKTKLVL